MRRRLGEEEEEEEADEEEVEEEGSRSSRTERRSGTGGCLSMGKHPSQCRPPGSHHPKEEQPRSKELHVLRGAKVLSNIHARACPQGRASCWSRL